MQVARWVAIAAVACSLAACGKDAEKTADQVESDSAGVEATSPISPSASSAQRNTAAASEGGAFAKKPGFQLPVPVASASAGSSPAPRGSRAMQIDAAGVNTAVQQGLEGTGSTVQVSIKQGGIVALSGDVENLAQLQRAQYLARAQPGVVEVDYRNLRVRKR